MDPDYYSKKIKFKLFSKLYVKIALCCIPLILSAITIVTIFGNSLANSNKVISQVTSQPDQQVLAVSDADFETGGVTFGIPTRFIGDALFNSDLSVEQATHINGELYYQGELIDLLALAENINQGAQAFINALNAGPGISLEMDNEQNPTISNTGVLSFLGETGDVTIQAGEGIAISGTTISTVLTNSFSNFLVSGGNTISASSNRDSLTFIPGDGISLAADATGKSITITSSNAFSGINDVIGIPNQVIVTKVGQNVILSLPQDINTAASVNFSEVILTDPITSTDILSITSTGRIATLNNANFYLGSNDTGTISLISKGSTSLLLDGSTITASGTVSGVTDFTASGDIRFTSLGNGVVQTLGYKLTSGTIDLSSDSLVSNILSSKHGGTGTDKTPTDGQVLIGSGLTGEYEPRSIATGNGISITRNPYSLTITNTGVTKIAGGVNHILVNGSYSPTGITGDITLTLPQILHPAASPTFEGLSLSSDENMITFNSGASNKAYLTLADLDGSRTYTLPNESGTICVSSGNCAGAGGGLVGAGTTNYVAKYSGAGTLSPSLLYDNGSSVGIGTIVPLAGVALDVHGSIRIGVSGGEYDTLATSTASGDPVTSLFWGNRLLCDSSGSCDGTAGAGISSTGTAGYLALFTGSGDALKSSLLYDTGSAIRVGTESATGFFTISGGSGSSALAINQTDSLKDILVASLAGQAKMRLTSVGDLDLVSGVYKSQGQSGVTVSGYACVITTGGIVTGSGDCPVDPSLTVWESQSSLIYAKDSTQNLAIGGSTVNNAKFAVVNIESGDPTIWLRSSPTRTLSLTSSGTIKTINDDNITLESGEDIVLSPGSGDIVVDGKLITPEGSDLVIEPEGTVSIRPHGQQVMSVSTSGVGINTALSHGALTIKELFSYAIPGEDDGGENGSPDDNLILNPADSDFSSNTGNWSLGSGWSIGGGVLAFNGNPGAQAILENQYMGNYVQSGITYTLQFDVVTIDTRGSISV
jgi:hypothetical protein